MSSLWTPEGEHRVQRDSAPAPDPGASPRPAATGPLGAAGEEAADQAELSQPLYELRQQLVATPAEVVVANHAYGLFELAAIHLSERPPGLGEARLAIDALGAVVEGLVGRLGQAEPSLVDALAQIRLAFVQIQAAQDEAGGGAGDASAGT